MRDYLNFTHLRLCLASATHNFKWVKIRVFIEFFCMCVFVVRERDELMEQLSLLKARYEEVKQREEVSYQQVKTSVQMVEQAELEQMQV